MKYYSVQSLREIIASIVPISPQDQILLVTGGKRLDPNRTLESYGLPSVCGEKNKVSKC
jgi:hypothetical protein